MNKANPLISIILPVYNIEKYIDSAITSLINQTYPNIEIIIINDGSNDKSGEKCELYAQLDQRIKLIHQSQNQGLSTAKNIGIEQAQGQYISFIDGDDIAFPNMIEELYNAIIENNADMSCCAYIDTHHKCVYSNKTYSLSQEDFCLGMIERIFPICESVSWNKLCKKELFSHIHFPERKAAQDEYVFADLVFQCKTIAVIDKPLYYYNIGREGSIRNTFAVKQSLDLLDSILLNSQKLYDKYGKEYQSLIYRMLIRRLINYYSTISHLHIKLPDDIRNHIKDIVLYCGVSSWNILSKSDKIKLLVLLTFPEEIFSFIEDKPTLQKLLKQRYISNTSLEKYLLDICLDKIVNNKEQQL